MTITILLFALAASALEPDTQIAVTTIPVRPTSLDQGKYVFSVSTKADQHGVAFHIVITAKAGDISPDSFVDACIATHWEDGSSRIVSAKPQPKITLKRNERSLTADFIVSPKLLQTAGACLLFTDVGHAVINGKTHMVPSALYEITLVDFAKP